MLSVIHTSSLALQIAFVFLVPFCLPNASQRVQLFVLLDMNANESTQEVEKKNLKFVSLTWRLILLGSLSDTGGPCNTR